MDCFECGNCKENIPTYFCSFKGDFVINENYKPEKKDRIGWKKGNKNYEKHRRLSRNEIEG